MCTQAGSWAPLPPGWVHADVPPAPAGLLHLVTPSLSQALQRVFTQQTQAVLTGGPGLWVCSLDTCHLLTWVTLNLSAPGLPLLPNKNNGNVIARRREEIQ